MKLNELRIGDWVLINGKVIKMDLKMFHAVLMGFDGYEPEPIPLTEEWLIKFGFDKVKETSSFPTSNNGDVVYRTKDCNCMYYLSFGADSMFSMEGYGGLKYIKHIHQLQNLHFALTNEEL